MISVFTETVLYHTMNYENNLRKMLKATKQKRFIPDDFRCTFQFCVTPKAKKRIKIERNRCYDST